jgi:hypothetical protein
VLRVEPGSNADSGCIDNNSFACLPPGALVDAAVTRVPPRRPQCSEGGQLLSNFCSIPTEMQGESTRTIRHAERMDHGDIADLLELQRLTREFLDHLMAMFPV